MLGEWEEHVCTGTWGTHRAPGGALGQSVLEGDGTYERRIAAADIVILLDYPEEVCLAGIVGRVGQMRPDIPWVERELDPALVAHVRAWRTVTRLKLLELLAKYPEVKVIALRSRDEAAMWLGSL